MCRLLAVKSIRAIKPSVYLEKFSKMAQNSKEYQGHGWGISSWIDGKWVSYHSINPIWEDEVKDFKPTSLFLAHARSAFQDEGIVVENNMPFTNRNRVFIFNGELKNVKINATGRIGAEKIFNFIQRFYRNGMADALDRAIPIIERRSEYIRAMNFVLADGEKLYVSSYFNEDPNYYNLYMGIDETSTIISSEPFKIQGHWKALENYAIEVIP